MKYTAEKIGHNRYDLFRGDIYIATVEASSKEDAINQASHCHRETSSIRHLVNR